MHDREPHTYAAEEGRMTRPDPLDLRLRAFRRLRGRDSAMADCCNEDCGWRGPITETVHPKHLPSELLCPECYEVVEIDDTPDPEADRLLDAYSDWAVRFWVWVARIAILAAVGVAGVGIWWVAR